VSRMCEVRKSYDILIGNLKGRDHLGDLNVDGRIILKWISRTYPSTVWIGFKYHIRF
jgi:hypothetical protein